MSWLVLALSVVVFGATAWIAWGAPVVSGCPDCHTDWMILAGPDGGRGPSYEVRTCPDCDRATVTLHGKPSAVAYCPSCGHLAMETVATRPPDEQGSVEVSETCHLCGHHREVTLELPHHGPLAEVIPFPADPEHPPRQHEGG